VEVKESAGRPVQEGESSRLVWPCERPSDEIGREFDSSHFGAVVGVLGAVGMLGGGRRPDLFAAGATDMRKGFGGLYGLARNRLRAIR